MSHTDALRDTQPQPNGSPAYTYSLLSLRSDLRAQSLRGCRRLFALLLNFGSSVEALDGRIPTGAASSAGRLPRRVFPAKLLLSESRHQICYKLWSNN